MSVTANHTWGGGGLNYGALGSRGLRTTMLIKDAPLHIWGGGGVGKMNMKKPQKSSGKFVEIMFVDGID